MRRPAPRYRDRGPRAAGDARTVRRAAMAVGPMITLIVARARNGAIGRDGTIPWDIPEDLRFFQRETLGGALIMGRRTWNSLPVKPLARRLNLVVSSDPGAADTVLPSVTAAIGHAQTQGHARIYGIGGARIYDEMLTVAHRLLISHVDLDVGDADTFFPAIDADHWDVVTQTPLTADCTVREYLRRG